MQITLDSSHTEHTQRSWHVDSICLQERYSEYVIKFWTSVYLYWKRELVIHRSNLFDYKQTFKGYIQCH